MNIRSNTKVETNKYELEVEVDSVCFEESVKNAFQKAKKNISVPGFRKGKAPRNIVEKMYGEGAFYEDAVNALIPVELEKAIAEAEFVVVDRPEIEVVSVKKDEGVVFKATCIVKPEVEIYNYKGIEVTKVVKPVTDETINAEIEKIRDKNARLVNVEDRAAIEGDEAIIDFKGFIDDVAFEGGTAEGYSLKLGAGQFIQGFEGQVVGHSVGEEFDVNVVFPEDYQMKEIAGKPAVFKIKLHEIKMKELPDVDDDFIKDTTEFDTVEAFKEDLVTKLTERSVQSSENDVQNKIFEQVLKNTIVVIPQAMVDKRVYDKVREFAQRLESQGMSLELYLQYTGMDFESFKKGYEEKAAAEVKLRLALEQVAKLENLDIEDTLVEEEFAKMASSYGVDLEQAKKIVSFADLKLDMLADLAYKLVKDSAKISE